MNKRRLWTCLGGGFCLTTAMLVQRVLGQGLPPGLPGAPPPPVPKITSEPPPGQITVPSKQIDPPPVIPIAPPLSQSMQAAPSLTPPPGTATPTVPVTSTPIMVPPPGAPVTTLPPSIPAPTSIPLTVPVDEKTIELPIAPKGSPTPGATNSAYRAPELTTGDSRPNRQDPSISVEFVGTGMARFNHPTNYQILVRNNGSATVEHVTVKPNMPEGAVIKSSEPALPISGEPMWKIGTLAPGQSKKIDVVVLSQKRGYQSYTATVHLAASASHLTEVREPLLQIKMKAPEKALVGEPAPIVFTISNPGDGMTENVKVRAMLPEGLDHPRGSAFEIDVGNLAPKETRTLQLACVAKGQGQMKATLSAMAEGGLSSTDSATFELVLPRIDLVLNGPKLRFVDRPARYTMKVSNPSSAAAQGVVVNEVVPAGFKFASASHQGRYDDATRTVSWQLGDLSPGQGREIAVDLIPTVPGDHRLAATVNSTRGVRNESAVQTRVEGLSNLQLEVSNADNPVEVGADATYEIRLLNSGTKAESNVEVVCTMPDGVEFRDAKSAAGSKARTENRDVIFEPLGRLAPRAEVIYRVTVQGRLPGDVRFRVRVRAEGMTDALIREETTKFYDDNAVR